MIIAEVRGSSRGKSLQYPVMFQCGYLPSHKLLINRLKGLKAVLPFKFQIMLPLICTLLAGGCAIHYYNEESDVEHVIGFGHMKMRVTEPNEGVSAVITGDDHIGLAAGKTEDGATLSLGWARSTRLRILEQDTSLRIEWPTNSMFNIRVGTVPPFLNEQSNDNFIESDATPQKKEMDL